MVCDQIGSPTSTRELANICWEIIILKRKRNLPFILHWSNSGVASWYDLANAIGSIGYEIGLLKKKAIVYPIKSTDYPSPAKRPSYSVLNTSNTQEILKLRPSYWRDELKEILYEIMKKSKKII